MADRFNNAAIEGLNEVRAAFKRVPPVAQLRFGEATQKTAFQILQAARARVRVRFGFLKQALDYSFDAKTGEAKVGLRRGQRYQIPGTKQFNGKSDAAVPSKYGHLAEFGHAGPHPAGPHPFMLPSAEAQRDPFLVLCRQAGKLIEQDMAAAAVMPSAGGLTTGGPGGGLL